MIIHQDLSQGKIDNSPVSEVVALKLRHPESPRTYLYPQLFAGFSYIVASGCMYELRRYMRKQRRRGI